MMLTKYQKYWLDLLKKDRPNITLPKFELESDDFQYNYDCSNDNCRKELEDKEVVWGYKLEYGIRLFYPYCSKECCVADTL